MKEKRLLILFLLAIMLVVLNACGSKDDGDEGSDKANNHAKTLRIAGTYPPDHPSTKNLEEFKKEVEEETDGQIEIKIYPANQLGDYSLVYEELMKGTIEMGLITVPTEFDSNFNINYANYLTDSYEEAEQNYSVDSFIFKMNEEIHHNLGVKFLGFNFEGMTGIGTVKEIKEPANVEKDKGLELRVPSIEGLRDSAEALGFRTVSIDYAELYQALQTGVADGWLGGSPVPNYTDVGDVINYYYSYNNWFETTQLLINDDIFNALSSDHQAAVTTAAEHLYQRSLEKAEENDDLYKEKLMNDHGVEVIEFSDEEIAAMKEKVQKETWPKLKNTLDSNYYEGLMKLQ